jgi:hypothetical protein
VPPRFPPQFIGNNAPSPVLVNVASGVYIQEGFINLDYHMILQLLPVYPLLKPFLSDEKRRCFEQYLEVRRKTSLRNHDCRRPLPFPDGSVNHILCSHFLEHVYPNEAVKIIRDFHRTLKPRGTLHAIVPDLRFGVSRYVKDIGSRYAANDFMDYLILRGRTPPSFSVRLREFFGHFGHLHRWMYDEASFKNLIESCGFQILPHNESPSKNFRIEDEGQVNLFARRI